MNWRFLSEDVILIQNDHSQDMSLTLKDANIQEVIDFVPCTGELAVRFSGNDPEVIVEKIKRMSNRFQPSRELFHVPVCYELGLDWEAVCSQTGLEKEDFIQIHEESSYVVSYGFTPGFLYLDGLDKRLHCHRRSDPRARVPIGSVGIGGDRTGIYSLDSPGGWQIIGQTPKILFDISKENPFAIPDGSLVKFQRISQDQFIAHEIIY